MSNPIPKLIALYYEEGTPARVRFKYIEGWEEKDALFSLKEPWRQYDPFTLFEKLVIMKEDI